MSNKRNNGQAGRAKMRNLEDVQKTIAKHNIAPTKAEDTRSAQGNRPAGGQPVLRVIPLGGQESGGGKNMILIEYGDDAIVTDVGFSLGLDLPGINYGVPDITYLEKIKHKVKGYIFTHGHLDHIGAVGHVIPKVPAPIYGSRFTVGMVEKQLDNNGVDPDIIPKRVVMSIDDKEKIQIGVFSVELVRVTHSIPECAMIVIDTPAGKLINTGDFRLDPEPLDQKPTNIERMREIGQEGVLLLMSESTTTEREGRTPTEHTLEPSFERILKTAPGRVFVATFSSNINRIQMIVDSAVKSNRKVAIDGRSMLSTMELAVKLGFVKIPRGTVVAMREVNNLKDDQLVIILTGSQGEENAALQRMSVGDHAQIKLKKADTVVLSSTPIPYTGNDAAVRHLIDDIRRLGTTILTHETHELDGCGPLHVSGHASRDEFREVIEMFKPKFFMPIYGDFTARDRHVELAKSAGLRPENTLLVDNGEVVELTPNSMRKNGTVPVGTVLVDQNGEIVPGVVIKDRLLLSEDGFVITVLTISQKTGQLLASPDIITRGFIYMRDSEELMNELRTELKRFALNKALKSDPQTFKKDLYNHVNGLLFKRTGRSPMIIPVVNMVDGAQTSSQAQPQNRSKKGSQGGRSGRSQGQKKGNAHSQQSGRRQGNQRSGRSHSDQSQKQSQGK